MADIWMGIKVQGEDASVLVLEFESGNIRRIDEQPMKLVPGDRSKGYTMIRQRLSDYVTQHSVNNVAIVASTVAQGTKETHLLSAELRGVVIEAVASTSANVHVIKSSVIHDFRMPNGEKLSNLKLIGDWNAYLGFKISAPSKDAAGAIIVSRGGTQ